MTVINDNCSTCFRLNIIMNYYQLLFTLRLFELKIVGESIIVDCHAQFNHGFKVKTGAALYDVVPFVDEISYQKDYPHLFVFGSTLC